MPFNIIRNDISKVSADAIVNTANPSVAIGAGVDSTIYEAAGAEKLLAERAKIGPMKPGQAAATPAFDLDAKYIIHTVGPAWLDGKHGEYEAVASCYRESLRIADELGCESVAFPLISTGTLGFPKDKALKIAISEISSFLFTHDMNVYMVVYDKEAFVISGKAFSAVRSFIEEKDVITPDKRQYNTTYGTTISSRSRRLRHQEQLMRRKEHEVLMQEESWDAVSAGSVARLDEDFELDEVYVSDIDYEGAKDVADVVKSTAETFQTMLFRIIDRKGLKDPEVYKKANIDRKLFSKIRSDVNYQPSKKTVLALAVALELNMDETLDLMRRAGFALSPSNRFDVIVGYCIAHKIYNIFDINMILFEYEEPLLAE